MRRLLTHPQDAPLKTFLPYRDSYLDEMLTCEGRGVYIDDDVCPLCKEGAPEIRCRDCFGGALICRDCILKTHAARPLHRIQVCSFLCTTTTLMSITQRWDDKQFVRAALSELGLRIQLGHRHGEPCQLQSEERELTIIDCNGLHEVKVVFCHCQALADYRQLLRVCWWPATPIQPRTAFTFNVLRQFHYQNLQGNITAFDFYRSLEFITDGTLTQISKVSLLVCSLTSCVNSFV